MADAQFTAGARVAIADANSIREAIVEKVHKSGNFTIRGQGPQQWRPFGGGGVAFKTGAESAWDRSRVIAWNDHTNAELTSKFDEQSRRKRLREITHRLNNFKIAEVSGAMLDALEAAIALAQKQEATR